MGRTLLIVAALLGLATGWIARGKFAPVIEEVRAVDPMVGILRQALAKVSAHDVAVTDSARAALDSFGVYKKRYDGLRQAEQRAETVFVAAARDSTVSKDSTVLLCSIVVRACQARAELAEREAQDLRNRLAAQVTLQPKRWSLGPFVGVGYDLRRKRPVGPVLGLGALFRIR